MARQGKFRHNVVVTGTDDPTKQVSKNAWNDDLNVAGMFGHTATTLTVSTGSITPINDMHKVDGEGAVADDLATIDNTETAEFDELFLLSGAQTITVVNSGNIVTLTGLDLILSTTIPTKFIRVGTTWYEVGKVGSNTFLDNVFAIQDEGDVTKQLLVSLGGATTNFDTTLTFVQTGDRVIIFPDATDTLVGKATTDTFTNKSIDANGTGNVITNIGDAEIEAHTSTKITITNKSLLNTSIVYEDEANTYGDFLQTFKDDKLKINSPDDVDGVILVNSDQTANRNLLIPVLGGNDTLATLGLAQTFSLLQTFTSGVDIAGANADNIQNLIHDISTTTTALDFNGDEVQTISITGATTFTASNYATGKSKVVKLLDNGSGQTLAFPAGWIFIGTKPTAIVASKTGVLSLMCFGATEADVVASYAEQE